MDKTRISRPKFNGKLVPSSINRWTGQPHEHKREIARHLRQHPPVAAPEPIAAPAKRVRKKKVA